MSVRRPGNQLKVLIRDSYHHIKSENLNFYTKANILSGIRNSIAIIACNSNFKLDA